ncbi:hypothetical protein [Capnocytophaga canis]|nr:hypothetical protein [Capnocytophaga canis]
MLEECKDCIKSYNVEYAKNGYELGFGRKGCYEGHSHYFFYDVLFSPDGIDIKDEKLGDNCYMIITPPRTFMNDIRIGNFFFLKFCPTNNIFEVPEKTSRILSEGKIKIFSNAMQFDSIWYKSPYVKGHIWMEATLDYLHINFNNQHKIKIVK